MRTHQTVWALALALMAVGGCGDRPRDDGAPSNVPQAMATPNPNATGDRGMGANREVPRTGAMDEAKDEPVGHP